MMDSDDWPRPSEEELPDLYDDIDEILDSIEENLRTHFRIENGNNEEIIFSEADRADYLECMDSNHNAMVPFFQKIVGLPDREFERQYGISGVGQRLSDRKTSFVEDETAKKFAEALEELMPSSLSLETVEYTFFKMWEADQRRFYRMRYEENVRDFLEENGYMNFKGNTLPEEPDFVIPDSEPYEVLGEVRVIQQKDREKRFKEFRSEAAEAAKNFPDAYFIAVANMGAYIERVDDREDLRNRITKDDESEIDAVFFHDERDKMLNQLEEWDVSRQQKLGE
jgi:hypothetical protein